MPTYRVIRLLLQKSPDGLSVDAQLNVVTEESGVGPNIPFPAHGQTYGHAIRKLAGNMAAFMDQDKREHPVTLQVFHVEDGEVRQYNDQTIRDFLAEEAGGMPWADEANLVLSTFANLKDFPQISPLYVQTQTREWTEKAATITLEAF